MVRRRFTLLVVFLASTSTCFAQYRHGEALSNYVHANERFGRKLLLAMHEAQPDTNVVLSPLPISQAFGALAEGSLDGRTLAEIRAAFEWQYLPFRDVASRMLASRIRHEKTPPPAKKESSAPQQPKSSQPAKKPPPPSFATEPFVPLSQSIVFLYRGKDLLRDRFVDKATSDYGIQFQQVKPSELLVPSDPTAKEIFQRGTAALSFSITTFTDLRTAWVPNLFTGSSRKLTFLLRSGAKVDSNQMVSERGYYQHGLTGEIEAVELPCRDAYVLVVLPAEGKDIIELEKEIVAQKIDLESSLKRELGDVTLPLFRVQFEADLEPVLKKLGLVAIFSSLDSLQAMVDPSAGGALLTRTEQHVDLEIDSWGVKARAVTFMGGIAGGVAGGSVPLPEEPFHMIVNRPFLFLIRDNVTDALLFAGAEMNPTQP